MFVISDGLQIFRTPLELPLLYPPDSLRETLAALSTVVMPLRD